MKEKQIKKKKSDYYTRPCAENCLYLYLFKAVCVIKCYSKVNFTI